MKKGFWLLFLLTSWGILAVDAQYTVLHNFNRINGGFPRGSLVLSGSRLYGMTDSGGTKNYGCVFTIDTNGNGYKVLLEFDSINGKYPQGSLIISGKTLYGMAQYGGVHNLGSIFTIDTDGNRYKKLLDFDSINGSKPFGSLILSGNILYGMTNFGGVFDYGIVFSLDTNGNRFRNLLNFNGFKGAWPMGSLILSGKVLYGMTSEDGIYGNIFSIDTDGKEVKDLYDFSGTRAPQYTPYGSLTLSGNKLYGMTPQGSSPNFSLYQGNIFSIDTNGNDYNSFFNFDINDGASPYGSLIFSQGILYGMTFVGGINGVGVICSIDTDGGKFKDMYDFSTPTGRDPWGDLTMSGNMLYGMTNQGGTDSAGVIFKFNYVTAGVNEVRGESNEVKVYPNPSNGIFNIVIASEAKQSLNTIEVYNVLGQQVYQSNINSDNAEINLSRQPNGVYLYRVTTLTGELVGEGKILLQK